MTFSEVGKWVNLVRSKRGHWTPIVLVGNKSDLSKSVKQVESETAYQFAQDNGLFYGETSVKDRSNIDEAFSSLIELLIQQHDEQPIWRIEEDGPSEEFPSIQKARLASRNNLNEVFIERRPTSPLPLNSKDQFVAPPGTVRPFELSSQSLLVSSSDTWKPLVQPEMRGNGRKRCCSII